MAGNKDSLIQVLRLGPHDHRCLDLLVSEHLENVDPKDFARLADAQSEAGNIDVAVRLCLLALNVGHHSALASFVLWLRRGGWPEPADPAVKFGLDADGNVAAQE